MRKHLSEEEKERRRLRALKRRARKEIRERTEKRGANVSSTIRIIIVLLALLIQIGLIIFLSIYASITFNVLYFVSQILSVILALLLFGRHWNSAFKFPWLIFMLISPTAGIVMYYMLGRNGTLGWKKKRDYKEIDDILDVLYPEGENLTELKKETKLELYHQLHYLKNTGGFPVYKNTDVTYFAHAKDALEAQIEDLKKAEKFIFFEYHAIENQVAFERLKKVFFEKAQEGVEVRILYDDLGSGGFISHKFINEMRSHGLKCHVFNPLKPWMMFFMNNRDHRKITVIDGKVGYTGGYNIADEYFDVTHPYGVWKDTGIRLEGDAVKSLSLIFLENWNVLDEEYDDELTLLSFIPEYHYEAKEKEGIILPYAESPAKREPLAETTYLNMIRDSEKYIYISTPYLIISDEMERELVDASKRGVEVVILTPGVPDKKIVYAMTRSYYAELSKAGVKIYEYTPGFLHAKMVIVDDYMAIVGTINFDYRSLYHHFENACLIANYKCLKEIKKDFDKMIKVSRYVSDKYKDKKHLTMIQTLLRIFAPIM